MKPPMSLYRIGPDDSDRGPANRYELDAAHEWGLPGVRCPACGATWAMAGPAFPALDPSGLPSAGKYRDGWPVTPEELEALRRPLLPLLPGGYVPPPGTQFGPLVGKARGAFEDFVWVNPWTLLLGREALTKLREAGVRLPAAVAPRLKFRGGAPAELLELQVEPAGELAEESFAEAGRPCPACGRDGRRPERFIVDARSLPSGVDIFRVRNFPTLILVTGAFAEAAGRSGLTGAVFVEVEETGAA